jgi:hypothetical protein
MSNIKKSWAGLIGMLGIGPMLAWFVLRLWLASRKAADKLRVGAESSA